MDDISESPMIPEWRLQMMANLIFRKYLSQKDKVLSLANSILEAHIDDAEEKENNEALLNAKQTELTRLRKKLDAYIEMRAEGDLSQDMYRVKLDEIKPKIQKLQEEIENLSVERKPKEVKDYREKLTILQYALEQYTHPDEGQDVPESVIEAFVVKIVVSKEGFDWYLRFDGNPDEPLHCQLSGKRRNNTKITIAGELSPAIHNSPTGCHQGLSFDPITKTAPLSEERFFVGVDAHIRLRGDVPQSSPTGQNVFYGKCFFLARALSVWYNDIVLLQQNDYI